MPTWNDPAFGLAHQYRNADNLQAARRCTIVSAARSGPGSTGCSTTPPRATPARIDAARGVDPAEVAGRLARDGVIRIVRQAGLFRAG